MSNKPKEQPAKKPLYADKFADHNLDYMTVYDENGVPAQPVKKPAPKK